jgi:nicotinamide riboside kinase
MKPVTIAIVGGECTGKTALCEALADALPAIWVPEYLREFVDRLGRAPAAAEQSSIFDVQVERERAAIEEAARTGKRWVAFDSAPIATALYSEMYFADRSLLARAQRHHRRYDLTLLADVDLPWLPDGLQRDGPAVRARFHAHVQRWLIAQGSPFVLISGSGGARLANARAALRAIESPAR